MNFVADPRRELSLLLKPAGGGLYLVSTGKAEQQAMQRRFYDASSDEDITSGFLNNLDRIATAQVVLLGVPSDVGAGFRRGASLGPQAIRQALLANGIDGESFTGFCERHRVVDIGDVFVVPQLLEDDMLNTDQLERTRRAIYPDAPNEALPVSPLSIAERAVRCVQQLNPQAKVFVLGGDHSVAWPTVKALHDAGRRFCIVQPDAHTDLLPERLGIVHCFATWTFHANDLIGRQKRVIQVGTRASRYGKAHWESSLDVLQFWAADVVNDEEQALAAIVAAAKATGLPVYFSNDIDGTDAAFADATGTPEEGGLSVEFLLRLIARLGDEVGVLGGDIVEVAPMLAADGGAKTVEVARQYTVATLKAMLTPKGLAV